MKYSSGQAPKDTTIIRVRRGTDFHFYIAAASADRLSADEVGHA